MTAQMENVEDIYPLTPLQHGLLFHSLYEHNANAYCVQIACTLHQTFDTEAFRRAWQVVLNRHATLRTAFFWQGLEKPLQVVRKHVDLRWIEHDWRDREIADQQSAWDTFLATDLQHGFDVTNAPLMRLALIQIEHDSFFFCWSYHHLLLDGWSYPLILQEVFTLYQGFCQGQEPSLPQPRPYRDYIAWLQKQDINAAEIFWKTQLQDYHNPIQLPVGRTETTSSLPTIATHEVWWNETESQLLQQFASQQQLTLTTLFQGAWGLLLHRYSGEADVVFGTTVAGRPTDLQGVESMVGMFINTLPVRTRRTLDISITDWLHDLQTRQLATRPYEYSSLVQIQGWSDVPRGMPLFESLLIMERYPLGGTKRYGIDIHDIRIHDTTNYPLTLEIIPEEVFGLRILYDCMRFDELTAARMLEHLTTILQHMKAHSDQSVTAIPLLSPAEQQQILEDWNDTAYTYPANHCLSELFESQVARTPTHIAAIDQQEQITYQELNQRANALAQTLLAYNVGPEVLVAILSERSIAFLTAILAIYKAGGAYLPLDPRYPTKRYAEVLRQSHSPLVLCEEQFRTILKESLGTLPDHLHPRILPLAALPSAQYVENLPKPTMPRNLAYVIYTSGSTGTPKGAMVDQRGMINHLYAKIHDLTLAETDCLAQNASQSFDISVWQLLAPLLVGGQVHILNDTAAYDPQHLLAYLRDGAFTVLEIVPSLFRAMLADITDADVDGSSLPIPNLRWLMLTGEALPPDLCRVWAYYYPEIPIINAYGPTECSDDVTHYMITEAPDESVIHMPIGTPIANTQLYILDQYMNPQSRYAYGELHVGGDGVGRGYLNVPARTADVFVPNPFHSTPGARLYKTGDRVRYLEDGRIEYLGRLDYQIKMRGFRIELGEIEARLRQHTAVQNVVVILREDRPGDQRLVAYLILYPGMEQVEHDWVCFVEETLPGYMVPSAYLILDTFPLTSNGKLDRQALPIPDIEAIATQGSFIAPRTATEQTLAGIWSSILGITQISVHDDFFTLGGHSLLATQVISRINKAFALNLPLRALFDTSTIADFAERIEKVGFAEQQNTIPPIIPVSRTSSLPLSFAQQRLWFMDQLEPDTPYYNIPAFVRVTGVLDTNILERVLQTIIQRHEILRTTFTQIDGQPFQVIAQEVQLALIVENLEHIPANEQEAVAHQRALEAAQQPFNLAQGPLVRVSVLRFASDTHSIFLTLHHSIADGWSLGVLIHEIASLYQAFQQGQPDPLPALPVQYADFAVWQREWLQKEQLDRLLSYWETRLFRLPPALELPTDRPRTQSQSTRGDVVAFTLPKELVKQLQSFGREESATLFMLLMATFQTLLYRYTAQEDIVVGTDVAGRNTAEVEHLIGFFVNQLVIRADMTGNPPFRTFLHQIRETTLAAYAHQDLPFDKLVEVLNPQRTHSHAPLFQVKLVLQNVMLRPFTFADITLEPLAFHHGGAHLDLILLMEESEEGVLGQAMYRTDLFDATTIKRLLNQYMTLLHSIVAHPDMRLNALPLIEKQERSLAVSNNTSETKGSRFKKFKSVKPQVVDIDQQHLVTFQPILKQSEFPIMAQPASADVDLIAWADTHREHIETHLYKHGAILFRGFDITDETLFERFTQTVCDELFKENGEHTPVSQNGRVQTPVFYPPEKQLLWHNENSFNHQWPLKICFGCVQPADKGGETPIVDSRKVFECLDPAIVQQFMDKQIMYVRNYGDGLGLNWQTVFKTESKSEVETMCREAHMEFEWKDGDRLRTRSIRPAVIRHPVTSEWSWFNQAQHWHIACLDEETRTSLRNLFAEEDLPRHCYYGDGSAIEDSVMEKIMHVYQDLEVFFPWQRGDVMVVDNVSSAHGRNPYQGTRRLLVALGDMKEFAY
ncbi:MAG: amino acid adenylation domain-containing protein [Chloroflexota bacterium]